MPAEALEVIEAEYGRTLMIDPSDRSVDQFLFLATTAHKDDHTPSAIRIKSDPTSLKNFQQQQRDQQGLRRAVLRFKCVEKGAVHWEEVERALDDEVAMVASLSTEQFGADGGDDMCATMDAIVKSASRKFDHVQALYKRVEQQHLATRILRTHLSTQSEQCQHEIKALKEKYTHRKSLLERANQEGLTNILAQIRAHSENATTATGAAESQSCPMFPFSDFVNRHLGFNVQPDRQDDSSEIVQRLEGHMTKVRIILDASSQATQTVNDRLQILTKDLGDISNEEEEHEQRTLVHWNIDQVKLKFDALKNARSSVVAGDTGQQTDVPEQVRKADSELFVTLQGTAERLSQRIGASVRVLQGLYELVPTLNEVRELIAGLWLVHQRVDKEAKTLELLIGVVDASRRLAKECKRRIDFGKTLRSRITEMDQELKEMALKENESRRAFDHKMHQLIPENDFSILDELLPGIVEQYVPQLRLSHPEMDILLPPANDDEVNSGEWDMLDDLQSEEYATSLLSSREDIVKQYKCKTDELRTKLESAEDELRARTIQVANLEAKIEAFKREIADTTKGNDCIIEELRSSVQKCQMEKQELQLKLLESSSACDTLALQVGSLRAEIAHNRAEFEESKRKLTILSEQQSQQLRSEHEAALSAIDSAHASEILKLKSTIAELSERCHTVSDTMTKELQKVSSERDKLRQEVTQMKTLLSAMEVREKSNADEHRVIVMSKMKEHASAMQEAREQIASLQRELEHAQTNTAELASNYEDVVRDLKSSQDEKEKLECSLKSQAQLLEEMDVAMKKQSAELERCKNIVIKSTKTVESLEKANCELSDTREQILASMDEVEQSVNESRDILQYSLLQEELDVQTLVNVLHSIQNLVKRTLGPMQFAVPLLKLDRPVSVLASVFGNQFDTLIDRVLRLRIEGQRISIDGDVETNDRVVFIRTSPDSSVWRLYTTDEEKHLYMHPQSSDSFEQLVPNHREHVAISARVIMIEDQEEDVLRIGRESYQLVYCEFEL